MRTTATIQTPPPGARPARARLIHAGFAALLAALLLIPVLAFAAPRGGCPFGGAPGAGLGPGFFAGGAEGEGGGLHRLPVRRLAIFLDLTEAQITDAQAIFEAARTEAEPLRTERRDLATQLREALDAAEPAPAAVGALVIALHDNREALHAIRQGAMADFEALLTPEQAERFAALGDARRAFGPRHHRGPRGGGPGPGRLGPGGPGPNAPGAGGSPAAGGAV